MTLVKITGMHQVSHQSFKGPWKLEKNILIKEQMCSSYYQAIISGVLTWLTSDASHTRTSMTPHTTSNKRGKAEDPRVALTRRLAR